LTALDALTHDAGSRVRKGRSRELGGPLVLHLFRLIKLVQMHSLENQAVRTQLNEAAAAFHDYRLKSGEAVALFFARGVVFFGGEPLKAPRSVYESALEFGAMMKRCGGSELTFAPDIGAEELRTFVVAVTRTLRESMTRFSDFDVPKVRLREVSAAAQLRGLEVEQLDEEQRIVRTYASAVVVMRRLMEDLLRGEAEMPRRIKRVAQALVDLSAGNTPAFLGVTAVRNANHDDAGRAVNTAILAVAMARRLTDDRATLTRIGMAALLLDAGRPRALRALRGGDDDPAALPSVLPDSSERGLPAGAAAVLTSLGRINEPTVIRSVVAYEALWSRRTPLLGALYRGLRPPTLHARIVAVARAYNDLLTPEPGSPPRPPAEALLRLEEELGASKDRADKTVLRLLMATVGLLPPGTLVQLATGASAVVLPGDAAQLRLRVLVEADGALPDTPRELTAGEEGAEIARIVGSDPSFARLPAAPPPPPASLSAPRSSGGVSAPPASAPTPAPASPQPRAPASLPPTAILPNARKTGDEDEEDARTVSMGKPSFFPKPAPASIRAASVAPPASAAPPTAPTEPPSGAPAAPAFSGDLQRSPVPHLLLNILGRKLSGTLFLGAGEDPREHTLVFEAGAPRKIRSQAPARKLGEILVDLGHASDLQIDGALARARGRGVQLGKQLVIDGTVSSRLIMEALSLQLVERIGGLSLLPPTSRYAFHADQDLLPQEIAHTLDSLAVVRSAIHSWNNQTRMEETLSRLGDRPLLLHPHAAPERFGFSPEEQAMIAWIFDQRLTFPELKNACADSIEGVRVIVYTLAISRHLDLGPSQWPLGVPRVTEDSSVAPLSSVTTTSVSVPIMSLTPSSVSKVVASSSVGAGAPPSSRQPGASSSGTFAPPSSVRTPVAPTISEIPPSNPAESMIVRTATPPPATTPPPAASPPGEPPAAPPEDRLSIPPSVSDTWGERRQAILDRADAIVGKDHYAVLGVERDTPVAEVQKAFLAAVKMFHPDRLPEPLADVRDVASRVFSAVVAAHKTLTDAKLRADYDASLSAPTADELAEQAEIEKVLRASASFQKAEILLRRNDTDGAEALAREAVEGDPQPEHLALLGWIHALRDRLPEALDHLNRAIDANPKAETALFYRGTVLKRMGHHAKAVSDFRRVVELNPKNLDASREVRLHEMRNQSRPEEDKPGLFGKLFSKKK
jgi:hypothetical protein